MLKTPISSTISINFNFLFGGTIQLLDLNLSMTFILLSLVLKK